MSFGRTGFETDRGVVASETDPRLGAALFLRVLQKTVRGLPVFGDVSTDAPR